MIIIGFPLKLILGSVSFMSMSALWLVDWVTPRMVVPVVYFQTEVRWKSCLYQHSGVWVWKYQCPWIQMTLISSSVADETSLASWFMELSLKLLYIFYMKEVFFADPVADFSNIVLRLGPRWNAPFVTRMAGNAEWISGVHVTYDNCLSVALYSSPIRRSYKE